MEGVACQGLWLGYRVKSQRGWRRRGEQAWALKDITLTVGAGELVGVIGGNGAGKSTLLQCLAGVLQPSSGSVQTSGRVSSLVELSAGFNRELTGRENTLIVGVLTGMSRAEVRERYEQIREFAELDEETMSSPVRTYSAGMILRLGFAIAVESIPEVLLVDEVLAVGDEAFQAKCRARIGELRDRGTAVVLVSHELETVVRDCERVLVLDSGSVVFEGDAVDAVEVYVSSAPQS